MLTRLQKVHAKFLESCRSLTDGRGYWDGAGPVRRWFAQLITPIPLMALSEEGRPLYDALVWLEVNCRAKPLSEDLIRHYHRLLAPKSPEPPGEYRRGRIVIERSAHTPPQAAQVPTLMKRLDAKLAEEENRLDSDAEPSDVLKTAVDLHRRLVGIHPFADANGRLARLLMNHLLRRHGQPYVILPALSESKEHFDALEEAHAGKPDRLVAFAEKHRREV
jgi:Fic family protein